MNMPFGSVLVASNETFKDMLGLTGQVRQEEAGRVLPWYFLSAGLSGVIASAVTQPLDVVKTRLQTQDVLAQMAVSSSTSGGSSSSSSPGSPGGRAPEPRPLGASQGPVIDTRLPEAPLPSVKYGGFVT